MLMIMDPVPQPDPTAPKPTSPPVMDIRAPARTANTEPIKTPPPQAGDQPPESVDLKKTDKKAPKPPKLQKPPKAHGNGVGLAIFGTIVIVLGLGALFVYAYLRTQGVSGF